MKHLFLLACLTIGCNDTDSSITTLRRGTQKSIDSIERKSKEETAIYLFTQSAIENLDFDQASKIIDSLLYKYPYDYRFRLYRGDLFVRHKHLDSALAEYSAAIAGNYIPIGYEKRSAVFILQNNFQLALLDLRKAVELNSDYNYSIGYTFELMKEYDSALVYYKRYAELNRSDRRTQEHIDSIKRLVPISI
jgi:tetratricopeptide (TPR) repeat protein